MEHPSIFDMDTLLEASGSAEQLLLSAVNVTNITDSGNATLAHTDGGNADGAPRIGFINLVVVQCIFGLIYGIIFSIGVTGNMLVCYVVCRNRAMHTVTNFFITNLAVSDIMLCLLAVPFTPMYTFMERWVFGTTMCHLVSAAQAVSVYISSLTLTAIALDRYIVIMYPFWHRMKVSTCCWLIALCWFIALVLTVPYGLYVRLNVDPHTGANYCEENWVSESTRKVFGTITFCLQFIVPFLVISFCYVCVSVRLSSRARSKPGSKTAKKEEADRDRKKRTNRMLMAMVGVFGVSWLPMSVVNIVNDYMEINNDAFLIPFFMSHCLAMSSTCYNPFLYAWLNENFRKEFKQVLPCIRRSGGYNDMLYRGGYRAERTNSQAEGLSVTRASEIVPRGPTCGNSIKKIMRSMEGGAVETVTIDAPTAEQMLHELPAVEERQLTPVGDGGGAETATTTTTTMLPGDLLETQFDGAMFHGK